MEDSDKSAGGDFSTSSDAKSVADESSDPGESEWEDVEVEGGDME